MSVRIPPEKQKAIASCGEAGTIGRPAFTAASRSTACPYTSGGSCAGVSNYTMDAARMEAIAQAGTAARGRKPQQRFARWSPPAVLLCRR